MQIARARMMKSNGTPLVSVVLCTYNGELYLQELLDSLSAQSTPVDRLVLRDDGSRDNTVDLVRHWAVRQGIQLDELRGAEMRLGPARSFLTALVRSAPADVHLLADQDDVWLPTKVERAVAALLNEDQPRLPVLYASRLQIVDETLNPLGLSPCPAKLSFPSAACESLLTGCTMALNEELRLLASRGVPDCVAMHDWWLYMLASATGRVLFDVHPTVMYRQHGANVIGVETTGWRKLHARIRRFAFGRPGVRRRQLLEFRTLYADVLSPPARALVEALVPNNTGVWSRIQTAWQAPIVRQAWHDRLATRLAILTNRF